MEIGQYCWWIGSRPDTPAFLEKAIGVRVSSQDIFRAHGWSA